MDTTDLHGSLGVRRLINASTTLTAIGGSLMPTEVLDAMRAAAGAFVDMHELHAAVGRRLAELTRNDAAYVTSGCAAALALATLACRTRGDQHAIGRMPDEGPDEVILHAAHRIPYDPAIRLAGAKVHQIGNALQTFDWELESALSERTAAVMYVAGSHLPPAALPLSDVVETAHQHGVPVIVDAAAQLPPISNLWHYSSEVGADLVVFSGGKALRGPQASGLMVGRPDLVEAARLNGAPYQHLARAMKAGKEEIVGLLAAVERYVGLDHAALATEWDAVVAYWSTELADLPGVTLTVDPHNEAGQPVPRIHLRVDPDAGTSDRDAAKVIACLRRGDPAVAVLPDRLVGVPQGFWIGPDQLAPGEAEQVVAAIRRELGTTS